MELLIHGGAYFRNFTVFHFFTKIKKRIIDQMIHNGGGFLWITSKTRYFGYIDPKRFFTTDPKRVNIASGNLNLTLLIHDIDQLFDKTSHLYGHFCSPFYPFYRGGKIDRHNPIVLVTTNKTTIHNFAGAYYKTLLFNYNERSSNLQPCHQQPCCSFSGIPSILWVVSMEMNEK